MGVRVCVCVYELTPIMLYVFYTFRVSPVIYYNRGTLSGLTLPFGHTTIGQTDGSRHIGLSSRISVCGCGRCIYTKSQL